MLASRFQRSSFGLTLLLRAAVARAIQNGIRPTPEFFRGLAARVPDATLRDLERRILRAGAMDIGDSPLDESELATLSGDLARFSAFDALLEGGAQRVGLRGRLAFATTVLVGTQAGHGTVKPVSSFEFDGSTLDPIVAVAILVATQELVEQGVLAGAEVLERELVKAAAAAVDGELVTVLTAGTPASAASSGVFAHDLNVAVRTLPDNAAGRIFALVAPATCRALATVADADGHLLHPDVDPARGGTVGNVRVVPCSALAADGSSDPDALVVDASQVALGASPMGVSLSTEAAVDMATPPSAGAAQLTSLFQTNSVGFRAERSVTAALVRENAVAVIEAANYEAVSP